LRTTDAIKSQSIGVDVFKRALWYNFLSHLIEFVVSRMCTRCHCWQLMSRNDAG
jgi:hypothetical protein